MDRVICYAGQQPQEAQILQTGKDAMIGLGRFAWAVNGPNPVLHGFALAATGPASLALNVGSGSAYQQMVADATAISTLSPDSTLTIKQAIFAGTASPLGFPAPTVSGQSINYLIQGAIADADNGAISLPYYDSSNPDVAYAGPSGNGTSQPTNRTTQITLSVVAGSPAATGTQPVPVAAAGNIPLWLVTVTYGMTALTAANAVVASGAEFLTHSLPILQDNLKTAVTGAGLTVTPSDTTQLYQAIVAISGSDLAAAEAFATAADLVVAASILPLTSKCVPKTGNYAIVAGDNRSIIIGQSVSFQTYTVPLSTDLATDWAVILWAENGPINLNPVAGGDQINGIAGSGNIVIPFGSIAIVTTDAAGHFFATGDWDLPKNRQALHVPGLGAAAGTIVAEGWEILPGGRIRKTCTMQLDDTAGGSAGQTWTFTTTPTGSGRWGSYVPPAFTTITGVKVTNVAGLQGAIASSTHAATTAELDSYTTAGVTLNARNSGFNPTLTAFYIEVEGL